MIRACNYSCGQEFAVKLMLLSDVTLEIQRAEDCQFIRQEPALNGYTSHEHKIQNTPFPTKLYIYKWSQSLNMQQDAHVIATRKIFRSKGRSVVVPTSFNDAAPDPNATGSVYARDTW